MSHMMAKPKAGKCRGKLAGVWWVVGAIKVPQIQPPPPTFCETVGNPASPAFTSLTTISRPGCHMNTKRPTFAFYRQQHFCENQI